MNLSCCQSTPIARPTGRLGASLLSLAFLACSTIGCAEAKPERTPVFPVKGTITFKGQPIPGALIALHPKSPVEGTPQPRANVTKEGALEVSTYDGGDGAPEGDYVLTVKWYKPIKSGQDIVSGPNVIPAKYARQESSNLTISVKPGENVLQPIVL